MLCIKKILAEDYKNRSEENEGKQVGQVVIFVLTVNATVVQCH